MNPSTDTLLETVREALDKLYHFTARSPEEVDVGRSQLHSDALDATRALAERLAEMERAEQYEQARAEKWHAEYLTMARCRDLERDAVLRAEARIAELERRVKFCPYCAGAFVPDSEGYEGPCAGCKRAERAEARIVELENLLDQQDETYYKDRAERAEALAARYEKALRDQADPIMDATFRSRLLRHGLSNQEVAEFVDAVEARERRARAALNEKGG